MRGSWVVREVGGWLSTLASAGPVVEIGSEHAFCELSVCIRSLLRLIMQKDELQKACSWNICSKGASIISITSSIVLFLFCFMNELQFIFILNASKLVHSVSDLF